MALVALVGVGLACSNGTPAPNADANARATGLAQTAAAILTSTAVASFTAISPTPTETVTPIRLAATDTPAPPFASATATLPAPPPAATACAGNDSDFVADVNVPDGTHFAAGTVFNKTWRLRNSGPCTWTTGFQLRYVTGDALGGATGSHTSRWQLFDEAGTAFGTKPYVQITVP